MKEYWLFAFHHIYCWTSYWKGRNDKVMMIYFVNLFWNKGGYVKYEKAMIWSGWKHCSDNIHWIILYNKFIENISSLKLTLTLLTSFHFYTVSPKYFCVFVVKYLDMKVVSVDSLLLCHSFSYHLEGSYYIIERDDNSCIIMSARGWMLKQDIKKNEISWQKNLHKSSVS